MRIRISIIQNFPGLKKYVIIVGGGRGERMKSALPKPFIEICGLPVLMHTIQKFVNTEPQCSIVVVLPQNYFELWQTLCRKHSFDVHHLLAAGGPERFHSVKSGLKLITDSEALIAVHDAVRPLVSTEIIRRVFQDAEIYGNAVPVVPVKESLREKTGALNHAVPRDRFFLVQTPQCYQATVLRKAYLQSYREEFTDDASVVEAAGVQIHLTEGNAENIKITTPSDLIMAEALLKSQLS